MNTILKTDILSPFGFTETCAQFDITNSYSPFVFHNVVKIPSNSHILTFYAKSDVESTITIFKQKCNITTEWKLYTIKFTPYVFDLVLYFSIPTTYYMYHMKLEAGNKATDWTLAPEDIINGISSLQQTADAITARVETNEGDISVLKQTAGSFETNISNINGEISSIKQTANGITTRVETTEENVSTIEQDVGSIKTNITNINGDISTLEQTTQSLKSQISDVNGDMSTLEQTVGSLTSRIETGEGDISTIEQDVGSIKTNISNINGDMSSIKQTADAITARITTDEGNISTIRQDVTKIQTSIKDINTGMSEIKQTATSLQSQISNNDNDISTIAQTVNSISTRVGTNEGNISTVAQTANKISWIIASGTSSSNMSLTQNALNVISKNITLDADSIRMQSTALSWNSSGSSMDTNGTLTIKSGALNVNGGYISNTSTVNGKSKYTHIEDGVIKGGYNSTQYGLLDLSAIYADNAQHASLKSYGTLHIQAGSGRYGNGIISMEASTVDMSVNCQNLYLPYNTYLYNGVTIENQFAPTSHTHNSLYYSATGIMRTFDSGINYGVSPFSDNDYHMGRASYRWKAIWAGNGTIQTSDINEKNNIKSIDERYENMFMDLQPVNYMWKNFKDTDSHDRVHCGLIAQQVQESAERNGLSSETVGAICKDILDEPTDDGRTERWGLNYGELHGLEIHMIQKAMKQIEELETQIEELKLLIS